MNESYIIKYKLILTRLLEIFDRICTENGLAYYACAGTALGAIRHHGIIPWDDDIDVFMPRKDYKRLIEISDIFKVFDCKLAKLGDEGYIYPFSKLYDTNTTLVEVEYYPTCLIGVYIDIFPLDEVSGTFEEIQTKKKVYDKHFLAFQSTYLRMSTKEVLWRIFNQPRAKVLRTLYYSWCSKTLKRQARDTFIQYEKEWSCDSGNNVLCHHGMYALKKELMPKEWFDSFVYVPFENTQIRVVEKYDKYLSHLFGEYMTLPPIEKQISHHPHYYLNLKEGLSHKEVIKRIGKGERLVF